MITTSPIATDTGEPTGAETLVYIGDMLAQLADMARGVGDLRLEAAIRLLAVYAASGRLRTEPGD